MGVLFVLSMNDFVLYYYYYYSSGTRWPVSATYQTHMYSFHLFNNSSRFVQCWIVGNKMETLSHILSFFSLVFLCIGSICFCKTLIRELMCSDDAFKGERKWYQLTCWHAQHGSEQMTTTKKIASRRWVASGCCWNISPPPPLMMITDDHMLATAHSTSQNFVSLCLWLDTNSHE